jgi:hypothetical protein
VATGDVIVVRYADDLVVGFENRTEAERFLEAFRERLAKFGLELHPEKTRLSSLGDSPPKTGRSVEKGSRRPLRSWASRTTAGSAGATERSPSGGKRQRSGWWPSCKQSKQNCAAECMSRWPTSVHGSERL